MKATTIARKIAEGEYDGELDHLNRTAVERIKMLRAQREAAIAAELSVGDRIEITDGISPKYMIGAKGTVTQPPRGKRVEVDLDHAAGRFGTDGIRVPLSCVRKVK